MNHANNNIANSTAPIEEDWSGLALNVINSGNVVLRTPAIAPGVTVRSKLPGLARHRLSIKNLDDAVAYINRARPVPERPGTKDDYNEVRLNLTSYRKQIYNAIVVLPEDTDNQQQRQWDKLVLSVQQGPLCLTHVEATAWILAEEVAMQHEQGISIYYDDRNNLETFFERHMRCSESMRTIIAYLC